MYHRLTRSKQIAYTLRTMKDYLLWGVTVVCLLGFCMMDVILSSRILFAFSISVNLPIKKYHGYTIKGTYSH